MSISDADRAQIDPTMINPPMKLAMFTQPSPKSKETSSADL
jgi:hypothetical protein